MIADIVIAVALVLIGVERIVFYNPPFPIDDGIGEMISGMECTGEADLMNCNTPSLYKGGDVGQFCRAHDGIVCDLSPEDIIQSCARNEIKNSEGCHVFYERLLELGFIPKDMFYLEPNMYCKANFPIVNCSYSIDGEPGILTAPFIVSTTNETGTLFKASLLGVPIMEVNTTTTKIDVPLRIRTEDQRSDVNAGESVSIRGDSAWTFEGDFTIRSSGVISYCETATGYGFGMCPTALFSLYTPVIGEAITIDSQRMFVANAILSSSFEWPNFKVDAGADISVETATDFVVNDVVNVSRNMFLNSLQIGPGPQLGLLDINYGGATVLSISQSAWTVGTAVMGLSNRLFSIQTIQKTSNLVIGISNSVFASFAPHQSGSNRYYSLTGQMDVEIVHGAGACEVITEIYRGATLVGSEVLLVRGTGTRYYSAPLLLSKRATVAGNIVSVRISRAAGCTATLLNTSIVQMSVTSSETIQQISV